jgi:hypothetical protein
MKSSARSKGCCAVACANIRALPKWHARYTSANARCVAGWLTVGASSERALELLHAGQMSVAEIGIELGFSDPREFRRAFKRWTGMPPQLARRGLGML